jgi:hypothetical protein
MRAGVSGFTVSKLRWQGIYVRVELSQAGALGYCARVWDVGFSMQEVWICEPWAYGGVTDELGWGGWRSERKRCGEVENGDVIVKIGLFEFEGRGLGEVKRIILNQKA